VPAYPGLPGNETVKHTSVYKKSTCINRQPQLRTGDFVGVFTGRRVWSLVRTNLNVEVKGQGHQGQKQHFWPFRWPACSLEHL